MRLPPPSPPVHPPGFRFLVIVVIVVGIVVLGASLSARELTDVEWARLGSGALILTLVAARFSRSAIPLGHLGRQAAILLVLGALLMVGYSYRDEASGLFGRALGTIDPSRGVETGANAMRFLADDSGQFFVDAELNGTAVHVLVDTGASGIALSRRDAARLGFQPEALNYTGRFSTANGMVRAAPVTLPDIEIGPLTARDVQAWVNEGDLDESLLGMSFLATLGRIEIKGDTLTLEAQ